MNRNQFYWHVVCLLPFMARVSVCVSSSQLQWDSIYKLIYEILFWKIKCVYTAFDLNDIEVYVFLINSLQSQTSNFWILKILKHLPNNLQRCFSKRHILFPLVLTLMKNSHNCYNKIHLLIDSEIKLLRNTILNNS